MLITKPQLYRAVFAALMLALVLAQLLWQQLQGGIVSHHFLHRADLLAISNAKGVLVLTAMSWILSGFIEQRTRAAGVLTCPVKFGFAIALSLGTALALAFTLAYQGVSSAVFLGILMLAVLLPVYRAKCLLGFAIAMSFIFGAVLPLIIAAPIALASACRINGFIRSWCGFGRGFASKQIRR